MKKNNRKGFTIVELVIVIAVIAVLAAVLIPTFSNVITKANHSAALQEARNKYLEVFADDIAEDGVLNINVTEAEGKGYTYTTADGKVTGFSFVKDGITVTYDVANDDWTVNGESQGGTGDNNTDDDNEGGNVCGHTSATDDGDCTTAVVCTECSAEVIAALSHTDTNGDAKCDNANCDHVMLPNSLQPSLYLPFDGGADGKVGTATELSTNTCYKNDNFVGPGAGSFSASFWINIGGIGTTEDDPALFTNKDWSSGANFGYLFFVQNKNDTPVLKFNVANSSGNRADEMIWDLPTNYAGNWIHVICVVDRVNNKVSVSFGFQTLVEKDITYSYGSTESFGDSGLYIGCDRDGEYILQQDTYMDDFMYFNEALDSDDVAALNAYYDALAGN